MIDNTREIALKILYKIEKDGAYSNIALDEEIKNNKNKINEKDIGLISQIVYGVTTWKLTIDEIIKKYSKIKLKKISTWILNILRIGIYQIIFLDKIPKSAAVNESVNLAKRYGHKSSSGFVNAILRKVSKDDYKELFKTSKKDNEEETSININKENNTENKTKNKTDNKINEKIQMISKTQSMPVWIIEELLKNNSIEETEQICKNLNLNTYVTIRANTLKITKQELKEKLSNKNIECIDGDLEDFLILKKVKNIENLSEFKQGLFTIQDESAGLTALILDPKPQQNILDACSAPGGKTTYLAQIMKNEGSIEAWDIYEHRIKLVEENAKRLGIDIIKSKVKDASVLDINYNQKFDQILLDVPCLGIGVIKRKPDIKWQRQKNDIQQIKQLQLKILETCSKYLKINGELVYSTCSIFKEENENIIEEFLQKNNNFTFCKLKIEEDNEFKKYVKSNIYLSVKPNEKHDGFFICKLRRNS